jgi:hypothetical protein
MAAVTITWNDADPANSDALNAGDDAITNFKKSLSERLRNGGHAMPLQGSGPTTVTTDGRHACGVSFTAGSAELAGEFNIYAADKTTVVAVFRDSTSAAATTAGNATGELFAGALAIRSTGIVKGGTVEVSTLLKPAATADNGVQDNAIDIGVDSTNRFRDLFLGRNAKIGGTLLVTGIATFSAVPVFSAGSSFTTLTSTTLLTISGGSVSGYRNATGTVTLGATDRVVLGKLTGNIVVTLPASSGNDGRELFITIATFTVASQTLQILPAGADTISGLAFITLGVLGTNTRGVYIICNGTNWTIINTYQLL